MITVLGQRFMRMKTIRHPFRFAKDLLYCIENATDMPIEKVFEDYGYGDNIEILVRERYLQGVSPCGTKLVLGLRMIEFLEKRKVEK